MKPLGLRALLPIVGGRWTGSDPIPEGLVSGFSTDTRTLSGRPLFFALEGEQRDGHEFVRAAHARGAIASVVAAHRVRDLPAQAGPYVVVDDPLNALERWAKWNRDQIDPIVVGVTGSVGKTSVKEFLGTLLSDRFSVAIAPKSYNNRLGVATTLLSVAPETEILVAELGTSGPGELAYLSRLVRPDHLVITEIAPAHLDGLRDLDGVVRAKAEIFDGQNPGGWTFVRRGIYGFDTFRARTRGPMCLFGRHDDLEWDGERAHGAESAGVVVDASYTVSDCVRVGLGDPRSINGARAYGYHFSVDDRENFLLPVPGAHNVTNALAAMCVAHKLGMDWSELRAALCLCRLPPLRFQVVEVRGVLFLNDSYNANPRSMRAAIEEWRDLAAAIPSPNRLKSRTDLAGSSRRRSRSRQPGPVAVLGDMCELGARSRVLHEEIGELLIESGARLIVTVGTDSRWIAESYRQLGGRGITRHFADARGAADFLKENVRAGDHVLIKGSRAIGLERVFDATMRWVKHRGADAKGVRRAASAAAPAGESGESRP